MEFSTRFAALCALALIACDSANEDPTVESGQAHWCHGLCDAEERCGLDDGGNVCVTQCTHDRPGLVQISPAGAALLEPCIGELPCGAITDEAAWDVSMDACWERAKADAEPTAEIRAFCEAWSETWFQCAYWSSTDECEHSFAMWADYMIDAATQCMSEPSCEELVACSDAVFS